MLLLGEHTLRTIVLSNNNDYALLKIDCSFCLYDSIFSSMIALLLSWSPSWGFFSSLSPAGPINSVLNGLSA